MDSDLNLFHFNQINEHYNNFPALFSPLINHTYFIRTKKSRKRMELKKLRDKCLLFNQFMIEKGGMPSALAEAYKESNRLIEKAYADGDPKPLKAMNKDIDNQVLKHMPLQMSIELKKTFKEKLGINFDAVDRVYEKAIEKVLKKGKIVNAEEYELLLNRVEEIYADANREDEVKSLNELLAAYHK